MKGSAVHPTRFCSLTWTCVVLAIFALALGTACSAGKNPVSQSEIAPLAPQLIARETFFGNPDIAGVKLSPDGTRISYLAAVDGVLNVWVGPADAPLSAKPVTRDRDRGIRMYFWPYLGDRILYLQDQGGDENWRVYAVDLTTNETRDLTPFDKVQAQIEAVSPKHPDSIVVGLNDRDPEFHDLYRIDLAIGARELIQRNDGYAGFLVDDDYRVRFAVKMREDGGTDYLIAKDGAFEPYMTVGREDSMTTSISGFDKSATSIYLIDSRGRNTAALTSVDLATGAAKTIYENARADVSGVMAHPTEKTIQAAASTYERTEWTILDESIRPDMQRLRAKLAGDIEVIDGTLDDRRWIVVDLADDGPVRYYLFDRDSGEIRFLFANRKALESLPLVHMHPVQVTTRDGLTLVNYLSLPRETDSDGDGRPDRPVPMVVSVHGGPWAREEWGYNPWHQWLANRGYAVLDVNFRGSTGFGKAFLNAGDGEWAGKMHDDVIDSVRWAIEGKIAMPDRIAIMGGSYGGYATLVGLAFTPDVFACGVDIVGPSNLITLIETIPPYWKPMMDMFTTRVGDPRTPEGRALLTARSPLTHADKIRKPLLIAQGANDPRVKQAESDQIVDSMTKNGIGVTYVLYPDEGHGFAKPKNRMSFYAVTDAFLGQCLGGRYEPVGDDFGGSSIEIRHGSELVPGLPANPNP
ncbi:MAG: S9 family peptidase [Deltaproteobacteria bacterium]|nr:S9 family peptidase [Deltaproteobacteria bacterium]